MVEHILSLEDTEVLNDRQKKLIEMIQERREVGRAEYVAVFRDQFCTTTLYWDLRQLRAMGVVERRRKGRFSYYRLKDGEK